MEEGLDTSDLVDVVPDELGVVELHVPVHSALSKQLVVIVILILTCLNHEEVLPSFVLKLVVVVLLYGELRHIVVHSLNTGRGTFQ